MNENNSKFGRVGVLLGGEGSERAISLMSGNAIFEGLLAKGIEAVKIDTRNNLIKKIQGEKIDRAFIALHGRGGEDGTVQGFLEMLEIPYTGSDTASSAIAMNKLVSKQIWTSMGLDTASYSHVLQNQNFGEGDASEIINKLGNTLFVKPSREGSSVGMSKVNSNLELITAMKKAQEFDHVLVEEFIDGKEYTVGIIDGMALPSINMKTTNDYYDYDAKYCTNLTEYFCPSGLNEQEESELQRLAVKAFAGLGCSGWGRVDFIRRSSDEKFFLLEVNTVPGMTDTSLVPKAALAIGIEFPELVSKILETSLSTSEVYDG